ncbi:MAG TPA: hypothetical protein IAB65_03490 [Candidatus Onthocola stercorigallinarum]|nr:hypothetical protein [Candidatus Onthocola stercorigallinarum]
MLYPIGYNNGEVVLNIGHTKILSTYSFSQNPANTVVTEVDVPEFVEYIRDNILPDNFITKVTFHEGLKVIGYRSFRKNKITEIQVILKKFKKMLNNKNKYNKLINKYREEHQDMILPNDISILELILLNELMNILLNVQEYKNDLEEYTSLSNKSVNRL